MSDSLSTDTSSMQQKLFTNLAKYTETPLLTVWSRSGSYIAGAHTNLHQQRMVRFPGKIAANWGKGKGVDPLPSNLVR